MDALLLIFGVQLAILVTCLLYSLDLKRIAPQLNFASVKQAIRHFAAAEISLESLEPRFDKRAPNEERGEPHGENSIVFLDAGPPSTQHSDWAESRPSCFSAGKLVASSCNDPFEAESDGRAAQRLWRTSARVFKCLRLFVFRFKFDLKKFSNRKPLEPRQARGSSFGGLKLKASNELCTPAANFASPCNEPSTQCVLQYRNHKLPKMTVLQLRAKLLKLNLRIYKRRKARPLPAIYETADEAL